MKLQASSSCLRLFHLLCHDLVLVAAEFETLT